MIISEFSHNKFVHIFNSMISTITDENGEPRWTNHTGSFFHMSIRNINNLSEPYPQISRSCQLKSGVIRGRL